MELLNIKLNEIIAWIKVRDITEGGIERLQKSIEMKGYNTRFPIAVSKLKDGYKGLDGNHRFEALKRLGVETVLAQLYDNISEDEEYQIAYESNKGYDLVVKQLWTDDAEFIWRLVDQGKTQVQIANILGWSRSQVNNFAALKNITEKAWQMIIDTTKTKFVSDEEDTVVSKIDTVVSITEGLLRSITSLLPEQQIKLIKEFKEKKIDKTKFKIYAEKYQAHNIIIEEAKRRLKELPSEYLKRALEEIEKGTYDKEYMNNKTVGSGFEKLIQQLLDEYAQKSNYRLIISDITELGKQLEDNSIDVIITDPPYKKEFLNLYEELAKLAAKVLKSGGSLLVMTGQSYLPEIMKLMERHIQYNWTCSYLTPGGQAVQLWQRQVNTFWKPILWYIKEEYNGKWIGDVIKSAVNDNDKRYHKWGQSESGMLDFIERFSNPGDLILDPFVGGGTTGVVATKLGRKFIGSDIDPEKIEITKRRLENIDNNDE